MTRNSFQSKVNLVTLKSLLRRHNVYCSVLFLTCYISYADT